LNAASVALLAYWSVALFRLWRTSRAVPTLREGLGLRKGGAGPRVCAVIPAHNEEESIGGLIESLKRQDYAHLRVVLCLDRCTDRTGEIARERTAGDDRFEILEIEECPPDWAGKVHAIWRGVQTEAAREAELLLFADADTEFAPACIRAAVGVLEAQRLDLLSLLSTLTCAEPFEKTVQPIAGMELVRQYPIERANRPPGERRRPFANGQFMLFRREGYEQVGGHEAVKDELLEDIALARRMGEAGLATGLRLADGLLRCRMYEDYAAFRRGWKRIYTEAAKLKVSRLRRSAVVVRGTGSVLPVLNYVNLGAAAVMQATEWGEAWIPNLVLGVMALVVWRLMMFAVYRASHAPLLGAYSAVSSAWKVGGILAEAARDLERGEPVVWGGREYVRKARE
jgi:glycosyltransferase involved in cell wall biosynthesis